MVKTLDSVGALLYFLLLMMSSVSNAQQASFLSEPSNTTLCLTQRTTAVFICLINRGSNVNIDSIGWYISVGGGQFESVEGRPRHMIDSSTTGVTLITGELTVTNVTENDNGTQYRCQPNNATLISNAANLTVLNFPPPIDSITVDETCSNDFTVSWTATGNDIRLSYNVTLSPPSSVSLVITMDNSYNFTRLMPNTDYTVTISAWTVPQCLGAPTTMMIITPTRKAAVPGVLISPPPMATNTSITIEWDLAEVLYCGPISSYILTIMNSTFMNTTRSTLSRFKFTGLMSNTSYNISVAAVNRAGTGLESNITVATITDEEEATRPPDEDDETDGGTGGLGGGAIFGIVFGVVAFVVVSVGGGIIIFIVARKKHRKIGNGGQRPLTKSPDSSTEESEKKKPKEKSKQKNAKPPSNKTEYAELTLKSSGAAPAPDPTKVSYTEVKEHEPLGYVEVQHDPGASDKPIRGAGQVEYKEILHQ